MAVYIADRESPATTMVNDLDVIGITYTSATGGVYLAARASNAPISERIGVLMHYGSSRDAGWGWDPQTVAAGQRLEEPVALFTKLEDTVVEEEAQRVGR